MDLSNPVVRHTLIFPFVTHALKKKKVLHVGVVDALKDFACMSSHPSSRIRNVCTSMNSLFSTIFQCV
jgi:hypothetical protein